MISSWQGRERTRTTRKREWRSINDSDRLDNGPRHSQTTLDPRQGFLIHTLLTTEGSFVADTLVVPLIVTLVFFLAAIVVVVVVVFAMMESSGMALNGCIYASVQNGCDDAVL